MIRMQKHEGDGFDELDCPSKAEDVPGIRDLSKMLVAHQERYRLLVMLVLLAELQEQQHGSVLQIHNTWYQHKG